MVSVWNSIGLACSLAVLVGIVYAVDYFGKKFASANES